MSTFEEILEKDGKLVYKTKGVSMNPMLYQNRDLVVIEVPKGRLKKYDVALYKRGKSYVLHRVIEVNENGTYSIRGDNTYSIETVPEEAVIAHKLCQGREAVQRNGPGISALCEVLVRGVSGAECLHTCEVADQSRAAQDH